MSNGTAPSHLTLHRRGPFRVLQSDGVEITGLSRRARGLLAYLSGQPGMRAERGLVADLLWSDRAEDQARASLRQELSVLRRALPDGAVAANRQSVWLDPARVRVDDSGGGVFLQGFDLASEGFEDWLRTERAAVPPGPDIAAPAPATGGNRPALAIMPFDELGAPEADMFADGVVEEITSALSRAGEFHVIARQSACALRDEVLDVPQTAERLGVQYVVEGTVRRAGERVRIAVQLINGTDGRTLWSERFDDRIDDLFDLQERIAAQVAGQVSPNLRNAEIARATDRPPADRTAYDLLLTAYPYFWTLRAGDNQKAIDLLGRAIEQKPDYGQALALKAWCVAQQSVYMWSRDPARDRAEAMDLVERAAAVVTDHAASFTAMAAALAQASTQMDRANDYVDLALRIDPNNAWAWMRRGWNHCYVGRSEEAIGCFEQANRLSPLDPFRHQTIFGRASALYRWENRLDEALALIHEGMRLNPGVKWPLRMLAVVLVMKGDLSGAQDAARELLRHHPHITIAYLKAALPPTAIFNSPRDRTNAAEKFYDTYFDTLAKAGVPEE